MRQVFCFACECKYFATLPSNVIIQPLVLFIVIKIVPYKQPHEVLHGLFIKTSWVLVSQCVWISFILEINHLPTNTVYILSIILICPNFPSGGTTLFSTKYLLNAKRAGENRTVNKIFHLWFNLRLQRILTKELLLREQTDCNHKVYFIFCLTFQV